VKEKIRSFVRDLESKETWRGAMAVFMSVVFAFTVAVVPMTMSACNASQVEADIQKVIAAIPTAVDIAQSIATIVATFAGKSAADPNVVQAITSYAGVASTDLKLADTLLGEYQTGLASAPKGVVGELDTAIATAQQNLGQILAAARVLDPKTVEAIGFAVAGVQSVVLAVQSLLPASLAAEAPQTVRALAALGATPGAFHVAIPSARSLAKGYDKQVKPLFPAAQVPVPAFHFLGIPL
jgi:hypothetical protein